MGADMLLAGLPAAKITAARLKRLHEIIASLHEEELNDESLDWLGDDAEGVRSAISVHVGLLEAAEDRRDVTALRLPGMPYPVLLTGGMSWGDAPTEIFETFSLLAEIEPVFRQLEEWARRDAGPSVAAEAPETPAGRDVEREAMAVLREFVRDVRQAYPGRRRNRIDEEALDWPDLADTYHKAAALLAGRSRP